MADERQTQAVEASPEEARFLRRFVRRTMLPWIACVAALAALALGVALAPPPPTELHAPAPGDARSSAAIEKLRSELASLREELKVLRSAQPARSTLPDEFEARLAKLESELAARPALAPQATEGEGASGAKLLNDLYVIRDRLSDVEQRLYTLESLPAAPASPAPSGAPR